MANRELNLAAAVPGTSIQCGSTAGYRKSDKKILKLICFLCGRWFDTNEEKKRHAKDRHAKGNLKRCDICNNFVEDAKSHYLDVKRHLPLVPDLVPDSVHQYIFPAAEELPQADDEALPQSAAAALLPEAAQNE